jgi:hypothetical protein
LVGVCLDDDAICEIGLATAAVARLFTPDKFRDFGADRLKVAECSLEDGPGSARTFEYFMYEIPDGNEIGARGA